MGFQKFDALISSKMPVDYWEDDQLFVAQEIAESFTGEDWSQATSALPTKNSEWRTRLLQSISECRDSDDAILVILDCLDDNDENVVEYAVDSLRGYVGTAKFISTGITENQFKRIEGLRDRGGVIGKVASDLLGKIKNHKD